MTSLCKLTATANVTAKPSAHIGTPVHNTQSKKGFWRRIRHSQGLITAESSTGGSVELPISEIWALLESVDPKLKVPTP